MLRRRVIFSAVLLAAAACGGNDAASPDAATHVTPDASTTIDAGPDPACVFGPPITAMLPHVSAGDEKAKAVIEALADAFAAQQIVVADSYQLPRLDCSQVWSPVGPHDMTCQIMLASGTAIEVDTALAQPLHEALAAAGAQACEDPAHGELMRLQNASVNGSSSTIAFDDASSYALPPTANVTVNGQVGEALLAAARAAAIDDCGEDGKIFLVCTRFAAGAAPQCSTVRHPLHDVDGSPLVGICLPEAVGPAAQLAAPAAQAVWDAVLAAAQASGYVPESGGPLSATTVINASYFSWDGHSLGFQLVADSVQPPPPPTMPSP